MDKTKLDKDWPPYTCNTIQEVYGKLHQTGCVYAFRGLTQHFDNLWSSIDLQEMGPRDPIQLETDLLKEFIRRAWNDLTPQEQQRCLLAEARWGKRRNTGWMVVARHRMVPTRCIDWTGDPLCSLLFACEEHLECDGEVWWFNRKEFDDRVAAQWLPLFQKPAHVEDDIERDFIERGGGVWFTALNYMILADDRLDRQRAWITVAGRLGTDHAAEIHHLGVRKKGRLVIPAQLKAEAMAFLREKGITRESLGFAHDERADRIAAQIKAEFFPVKT